MQVSLTTYNSIFIVKYYVIKLSKDRLESLLRYSHLKVMLWSSDTIQGQNHHMCEMLSPLNLSNTAEKLKCPTYEFWCFGPYS